MQSAKQPKNNSIKTKQQNITTLKKAINKCEKGIQSYHKTYIIRLVFQKGIQIHHQKHKFFSRKKIKFQFLLTIGMKKNYERKGFVSKR